MADFTGKVDTVMQSMWTVLRERGEGGRERGESTVYMQVCKYKYTFTLLNHTQSVCITHLYFLLHL